MFLKELIFALLGILAPAGNIAGAVVVNLELLPPVGKAGAVDENAIQHDVPLGVEDGQIVGIAARLEPGIGGIVFLHLVLLMLDAFDAIVMPASVPLANSNLEPAIKTKVT